MSKQNTLFEHGFREEDWDYRNTLDKMYAENNRCQ
jgi:hypothetical protein